VDQHQAGKVADGLAETLRYPAGDHHPKSKVYLKRD
jgi:hypothetical protein